MRLLMLAPGPPSAAGKGYQVRLYNQILVLAERHEITLLTFVGKQGLDPKIVTACKKVVGVPWSARMGAQAALMHAATLPLTVGLYRTGRMIAALTEELRAGAYDLAHLQLVRMAPYLNETRGLPTVLDLLDAYELNMRERARAATVGIRQLFELEARRLGAFEHKAIGEANLSLLISRRDLAFLGNPPSARVQPNGVEPRPLHGEPPAREATSAILTGTMSYFPNADAAVWYATEIMPLVRSAVPSATFRIVGREPIAAVARLASLPGVSVKGAVPVIAEDLARAMVSVCPVRLGSGLQTKVLEAMAVGTPVVATSKALEGIPEDLHRYVHLADSPATFAGEVARILNEPGPALELAGAGLEAIERGHTWRHSVRHLEILYEELVASRPAPPRQ
jgi:glycosyltransferase involved in cell wall biosynthesis